MDSFGRQAPKQPKHVVNSKRDSKYGSYKSSKWRFLICKPEWKNDQSQHWIKEGEQFKLIRLKNSTFSPPSKNNAIDELITQSNFAGVATALDANLLL